MRKSDWRSVLGRKSGAAADRLDAEVERIVKSLRQGKAVKLPGVGVLVPGKRTRCEFEEKGGSRGGRG